MQSTKHERSGYATATFFTLFDTGLAIGSYVLGIIAIHYGYQNVYLTSATLVFLVFLGYLFIKWKQKGKEAILNS